MDSQNTAFKTAINASTPDEEYNYSTSTKANMNAVGHRRSTHEWVEWRQRPPPTPLAHALTNDDLCSHLLMQVSFYHSTFTVASKKYLNFSTPTNAYVHLLMSYPQVFSPELNQKLTVLVKHCIYHQINTRGSAELHKSYTSDPHRLAAAERNVLKIIRNGSLPKGLKLMVISLSHITQESWLPAPLWGLKAPEHADRAQSLPPPKHRRRDLLLAEEKKVFSTLNLLKLYYQVLMNTEDIPKTDITIPFTTYINYFCLGLCNAEATFEHHMHGILGNLLFRVCCMDNMLVFSSAKQKHCRHLRLMVDHQQQNSWA
ncbi:uncharacterized protein [Palaemon carinicauda]|uniref:uncharacterized protein n=1 Tax=Palaemon carinicauda TaxID=392227 RepID=UPI0035B5DE13